MIKIQSVLNGTQATITTNDATKVLVPQHVGQAFDETEADTIVVECGAVTYTCEDGSFVVLTTGTKKAVFDVSAPAVAPAPAEPVFAAPEAPAPEAPAV
jgi:hypothetical protein